MNDPGDLSGRIALVTGGNSGIGAAVSHALARAGAETYVDYVSHPESTAELVGRIEAEGGRAHAIEADVSDEQQVEAMFARIAGEAGPLDVVISNAGVQRDAPLLEMELSQWRAVLDVNLTGAFLCARAAARQFFRAADARRDRPSIGCLIFMSSVHQTIPWAGHANYAASKGGLEMFMKSAAQELAGHGIRINSIAPGAIATPINDDVWKDAEGRQRMLELIPSGRIGEPEDVGRVAAWLASDAADYVHGTTLFADGGMMSYPGFRTGG